MKNLATNILSIFLALLIGAIATRSNIEMSFTIFGAGLVLIGVLVAVVNYRNGNYIGMIFTTLKEMRYQLTTVECNVAIFALALMASPFVYMLWVAVP